MQVLKKLGIKALKHGLDADEAAKKKQEEEEEEYATRRVPRELKMVICQMIYKRAKVGGWPHSGGTPLLAATIRALVTQMAAAAEGGSG